MRDLPARWENLLVARPGQIKDDGDLPNRGFAADQRRGFEQGFEWHAVVDVGAAQRGGEWNAVTVADLVALGAGLPRSVGFERAAAPPFLAGMGGLSMQARLQSIRLAPAIGAPVHGAIGSRRLPSAIRAAARRSRLNRSPFRVAAFRTERPCAARTGRRSARPDWEWLDRRPSASAARAAAARQGSAIVHRKLEVQPSLLVRPFR